jgi:NADPH:quinone reductase-like Zn-dependent oxidoreductase
MSTTAWDLLVRKDELSDTRIEQGPPPAPDDGEVVLKVESFAITANNVTYGMVGDQIGYWQFFPAPEGEGRLPVWGFARVESSAHPEFAPGDRFYGYWPMSSHLKVRPRRTHAGFVDESAHRAVLPPTYNIYAAAPAGGAYEAERSVIQFTTGFLIEDFLEDSGYFGADKVIVTSASSRTAVSLAQVTRAAGKAKVTGLTSPRNRAFVESLGYYDEVILYDDLETAGIDGPAVMIDFAGDPALIGRIHTALGDGLKYSCLVGLTHQGALGTGDSELPGPQPIFFFAPDRIRKRRQDWGAEGFQQRHDAAWQAFAADTGRWLTIDAHDGAEGAKAAYLSVLRGEATPDRGVVVRP